MPSEPPRLTRRFYARDPQKVALDLLGRTLYRSSPEGLTAGRIVEVEAYLGQDDPGSHAFRRRTPRNSIMFGPPGHLYVYFTYGMHHCANVVCDKDGVAGAVLLRAIEPVDGIELMQARRNLSDLRLLAKGPGRLCQAMALTTADNGADLSEADVWIWGRRKLNGPIGVSHRIGLPEGMDQPWRYFEAGPWVSGPKRLTISS